MQTSRLDRFVSRLLMVDPDAPEAVETEARRAFNFSLIFTGVRCLLQYIVLPFVLPVLGVAADIALPLMLAINVLAIISMFYSVRRFWQINYQYKWQYLIFSLFLFAALVGFMALDVARLTHPAVD